MGGEVSGKVLGVYRLPRFYEVMAVLLGVSLDELRSRCASKGATARRNARPGCPPLSFDGWEVTVGSWHPSMPLDIQECAERLAANDLWPTAWVAPGDAAEVLFQRKYIGPTALPYNHASLAILAAFGADRLLTVDALLREGARRLAETYGYRFSGFCFYEEGFRRRVEPDGHGCVEGQSQMIYIRDYALHLDRGLRGIERLFSPVDGILSALREMGLPAPSWLSSSPSGASLQFPGPWWETASWPEEAP